jgi:hypothetical protein
MLQPLLEIYLLFESSSSKFTDQGLNPISFLDVYRSQPLEPELYEYFQVPAIFIDYSMQGFGIRQPRRITMTLHIITDEMPDASNISEQKSEGLKRFLYLLLIQQTLEGCKLGKTTGLKFVSENIVDVPVVNYHTQTYEFEAFPVDMIGDIDVILGEFERLNLYERLRKNL